MAKLVPLVCHKVLAKTEKAVSVWLEDMSQNHIPIDGKIMREKALSLCKHYCEGIKESQKKEFEAGEGQLTSYEKHYSGESALTDAKATSAFPEEPKSSEVIEALKPKTVNACWKPLWSEVLSAFRNFPTIDLCRSYKYLECCKGSWWERLL